MAFLAPAQTHELVTFARHADFQVRADLTDGIIRDENDYTSNFTGTLRRMINSYSHTGLRASSFLLKPKTERATGTDAAIILQSGGLAKAALFEAKWPRFGEPGFPWDSEQTASGLSHFSDQLDRQSRLSPHFAVFEIFYCELPIGHRPDFLQPAFSSCVWHREAAAFRAARETPNALWSDEDLKLMLTGSRHEIGEILQTVAECREGKAINSKDAESTAREYGIPGPVLAIDAAPFEEQKTKDTPPRRRRR